MNTKWICKEFNKLSTAELYVILRLRNEVFVLEQNCAYLDTDGKDQHAWHLMIYDNDKIVGYCRIIPPGISYTTASIGRVVTSLSHRRTGVGKELMKIAIDKTLELFACSEITISAQLYLKKFYESFGFVQISDVYLEDDIDHIKMIFKK
jgi:ElaA protein